MSEKGKEKKKEYLVITSGKMWQPYNWYVGEYWTKFFDGFKEKKFLGIKCSKCGTVYALPRQVCGRCFVKMDEWVELGPEGVIGAFTVVKFPYIDPNTGEIIKPLPFTVAAVRLDGADSAIWHYVNELDESKIKVGRRVRIVWQDERKGNIHDIKYFEFID
ncbi:MAG: Zn-ribbon domain-containing OB-fold protein [Candidatus Jordarchaeum sp.]|uniref:Zn-ribbon domain-containing OB-fold protein n=1 Tax=Candidatus Jordarchaeum sp. TaxID=2823881 RepID=UPI00404A2DBE